MKLDKLPVTIKIALAIKSPGMFGKEELIHLMKVRNYIADKMSG